MMCGMRNNGEENGARRRRGARRGAAGNETAHLSSDGPYTLFSFADRRLKFRFIGVFSGGFVSD